jgi:hypothetical protein
MRQRGRKSATLDALPAVNGEPSPLKPPAGLNKAEQSFFAQVIAACSPSHFVESDLPLLVSFVQSMKIDRDPFGSGELNQFSLFFLEVRRMRKSSEVIVYRDPVLSAFVKNHLPR